MRDEDEGGSMKLEEIRKLIDAATPGPWTNRMQDGLCNKYIDDDAIVISKEERDNMNPANVAFIALSRTLMPKLLAVAKVAKAFFEDHLEQYGHGSLAEWNQTVSELGWGEESCAVRLGDALAALEAE